MKSTSTAAITTAFLALMILSILSISAMLVSADPQRDLSEDRTLVEYEDNQLNVLEEINDVLAAVTSSSGLLEGLAGGNFTTANGSEHEYEEYIWTTRAGVEYTDNSDASDDPADYLHFNDNELAYTYHVLLGSHLWTPLDEHGRLTEIEGRPITLLGTDYLISRARHQTDTLHMDFLRHGIEEELDEGESHVYSLNGIDYEITLDYVSSTQVRFTINGEHTDLLTVDDYYVLEGGEVIKVKAIHYGAEPDRAEFYFGTGQLMLRDNDYHASEPHETMVKVSGNTITDAASDMYWYVHEFPSGTWIRLYRFEVSFSPSDDIYVAEGSDFAAEVASERGDEDWALLRQFLGIDYAFEGIVLGGVEQVRLHPSGSSKLELDWTNKAGDSCDNDLFYSDGTYIYLQDGPNPSKRYSVMEGDTVVDEGYFLIEKNEYSRIMQAKSIDPASNEFDLKDACTGSIMTVSYSPSSGFASFYMDGNAYGVVVNDSGGSSGYSVRLLDITDDDDSIADLWTEYGHEIRLDEFAYGPQLLGGILINEAPLATRDDVNETHDYFVIGIWNTPENMLSPLFLSSTSPIAEDEGSFLISHDSNPELFSGRTRWGSYAEYDTSGSQDTVTLWMNELEANPQVYVQLDDRQEPVPGDPNASVAITDISFDPAVPHAGDNVSVYTHVVNDGDVAIITTSFAYDIIQPNGMGSGSAGPLQVTLLPGQQWVHGFTYELSQWGEYTVHSGLTAVPVGGGDVLFAERTETILVLPEATTTTTTTTTITTTTTMEPTTTTTVPGNWSEEKPKKPYIGTWASL